MTKSETFDFTISITIRPAVFASVRRIEYDGHWVGDAVQDGRNADPEQPWRFRLSPRQRPSGPGFNKLSELSIALGRERPIPFEELDGKSFATLIKLGEAVHAAGRPIKKQVPHPESD